MMRAFDIYAATAVISYAAFNCAFQILTSVEDGKWSEVVLRAAMTVGMATWAYRMWGYA